MGFSINTDLIDYPTFLFTTAMATRSSYSVHMYRTYHPLHNLSFDIILKWFFLYSTFMAIKRVRHENMRLEGYDLFALYQSFIEERTFLKDSMD